MTARDDIAHDAQTAVSEMNEELEAFRQAYPTSTFMAARAARAYYADENYEEAIAHARIVVKALRRVPIGATQLVPSDMATLQATCADTALATRMALTDLLMGRGDKKPDAKFSEEVRVRERLIVALERVADLLGRATAVYIATEIDIEAETPKEVRV